jgi:hypothetical protein
MSRGRLLVFACTSLLLMGCDRGLPTATQSAIDPQFDRMRTNAWVAIDQDFLGNCTGETFHITGKAHVVQTIEDDGNGNSVFHIHVNTADIKGTSLGGTRYIVMENAKEDIITEATGPVYELDLALRLRVISEGALDNWFFIYTAHLRIAPPETPEFTLNISEECRG